MMRTLTKSISGWGRYPVQSCELLRPEKYADLHAYTDSCIARGQGRSYGDASLNKDHAVILTERLNRFVRFDHQKGIIAAEAGLSLQELLAVIVPAGWFLPVTPGTQFVSLGGCVAADVHGKNHHRVGSFGQHVISFKLILADESHITCSPGENSEIFWATIGGMGLTGIIGEVTLQLIPLKNQAMRVEHHAVNDLAEMGYYDDDYTVTWLDTQRERGIAMTAHHAENPVKIKPKKSGLKPPSFLLNNYSIKLFNNLYFMRQSRKAKFTSHYQDYFYPLDAIKNWNTMYGKKGFVQYQAVFPKSSALIGVQEILKLMRKNNAVSFLSVLKRLGKPSGGLLSFPIEGLTLAMDIAFDHNTLKLLREFDHIVLAHQGRVYLAKDACLSAKNFRSMYPHYEKFLKIKHKIDPKNIFQSSLSKRLEIGH